MNYRHISATEVWHAQLVNLGLHSPNGIVESRALTADTIASEIMRTTLWGLSRTDSGSDWLPVYVTKLISRATKVWKSVDRAALQLSEGGSGAIEQRTSDFFKQIVEELELIGDLASLPKGMWLPAPARVVHLSALERWLVVGGIPTSQFPRAIQDFLEHRGSARFFARSSLVRDLDLPTQSSEDWLRVPKDSLVEWTLRTMDGVSLEPTSRSDGSFRFYSPNRTRLLRIHDNLQVNRWYDSVKVMPDGRCLFRHTNMFGAIRYGVAEIQSAKVTGLSFLDLRDGAVRRLMYGLDALAQYNTQCRREATTNEYIYILQNEVPGPERRLLTAVGRLLPNNDNKYYPRRWAVPCDFAPEIDSSLTRLGITILS